MSKSAEPVSDPPSDIVTMAEYKEVPCKSCDALIVWMKTKTGANMPVNAKSAKFGDTIYDASAGHISHFATCPNASLHRKPRA